MSLADTINDAARRIRGTDWREVADDVSDHAARRSRELSSDARSELARLRKQVEFLMRDRVRPALDDAADTISSYGREARHYASDGADRAVRVVRERPFLAIGIAAAAGVLAAYLAACTMRRD
ncbi:hypothetical protein M0638_00995 [Roseomonas sp. NAR14]|uniref:DUF883 domain-containing protein n=1 Tax=Roseomonas acroporae TaxID=2937791 RepID=A0A9X1YAM6_9PROT|nr:hypothetical protein [Roseomonas acroporae]MCK8782956.1 hypothetical protein [Roseomonas acroporae]